MAITDAITHRCIGTSRKMYVTATLQDPISGISRDLLFMIDTGSDLVILPANALHLPLSLLEEKVKKDTNLVPVSGIDGELVAYYTYIVSEFKVGRFSFRNFPIQISFDKSAKFSLLGMSFLSFFNIFIDSLHRSIAFSIHPEIERSLTCRQSSFIPNSVDIDYTVVAGMLEQLGNMEFGVAPQTGPVSSLHLS